MTPRLELSAEALTSPSYPVDTRISLLGTGFRPGARVRLTATVRTEDGQRWASAAEFDADEQGSVDPTQMSPHAGTYVGIDEMGLFWSMRPDARPERGPTRFRLRELKPLCVGLTAESGDGRSATAEINWLLVPPSVSCERLVDPDGVGIFFRPAGPGPHPIVVVLGGSNGGISAAHAALLAGHGFATLALSYFGVDPLPRELIHVPLEFWRRARSWLDRQHGCDPDRLAVVGSSKGAELALLLASCYPSEITAVIGYAPSGVVYQGIPALRGQSEMKPVTPMSSWTLNGSPLPFVRFAGHRTTGTGLMIGPSEANPMSLKEMHENPLADIDVDHPAFIAVERIAGPVLLISGADDEIWPATRLAEMIVDRLAGHGRGHLVRHVSYPNAGHLIGIPYLPTYGIESFGGGPEANAAANADSWSTALTFLHTHLD